MKILSLLIAGMLLCGSCSDGRKTEMNPIDILKNVEENPDLVIRFARLEIDSTKLGEYLVFLKEGIETSIATEPGVLTMYGVQEQEDPTKITMLEIYLNDSAYRSHLQTTHFQKYKQGTMEMVRSLDLIDLDPVIFGVRDTTD